MQARLSFLVLLFSALLLLASPAFSAGGSAPTDEGVSPRCEAAIDKAAGRYSQCLLKASAKYAKKKNQDDRLLAQQMRCGDKYNAQVARAQDRFGEEQCTPYTSQIADRTATCAEEASIEAGGKAAASRLYVQDATGGTLTETTLVLLGVDESTPWFTDRPYREAGQTTTADFVALFAEEGPDSFAENPPNADFTCESGGEVVNQVVMLTDPVLDETAGTLTYTVDLVSNVEGGGSPTEITCDGDAHLFVDDVTIDVAKLASACRWDAVVRNGCMLGGGMWDSEKGYCIPSVMDKKQLTMQNLANLYSGCEAVGGTWKEDGRNSGGSCTTDPNYNCLIAAFCSRAAREFPAALWMPSFNFNNLYKGHSQAAEPASGAGCNVAPGNTAWLSGAEIGCNDVRSFIDIPDGRGFHLPTGIMRLCARR